MARGRLLQQGGEDALQLGEAGTQGRAGEEVQLVGRVKGQDGDEPPAPRRAIWQSLEGTKGEILTSGAARGTRGSIADGKLLLLSVWQCKLWLRCSSEQHLCMSRLKIAG